MANRFLNVNGSGGSNLNDGTTPIFASTLGAASLTASTALKTDANGLLTSTPLDITDVTGLQTDLNGKLSLSGGTLTGGVTVVDNLKYVTEVEMEHQNAHTTPGANSSFMYVKTDNKLYLKDSAGNEVEVSGEGEFPSSSTNLGVALFQGTSGKVLKDAGGNLTWDEDVFKLQTPTVQGKSGDLTLESNGGGSMTVGNTDITIPVNNLVVSTGNIELNGATAILDIDDGTSRGVIRGYGSSYIDSATSRSYSYLTSADGVVHNLSNTAQSHDFKILSISKLAITDSMVETTTPLLVTDGTILLEPSTSASATTGTSTEIFSDSGTNNNLTFVDNSIEYPIAGQQLITVKYSKRFAGNISQTLYTDTNIEFLWDATNLQVQYRPKTYVGSYIDATILFVPGNANNTVKDKSDDYLFVQNSSYWFSGGGSADTAFNMGNYGARQFLSLCPETAITSESPCYRLDLMGGNTSNMNITIEKQSV